MRRYSHDTSVEERRYPHYLRQNAVATGQITATAQHAPPGTLSESYFGVGQDEIEGSVLEARSKIVSQFRSYQESWTDLLALLKVEPL